jgi:hypothetical protein
MKPLLIHVSDSEELTGDAKDRVDAYLAAVAEQQAIQQRARELAGRLDDTTPHRRRKS